MKLINSLYGILGQIRTDTVLILNQTSPAVGLRGHFSGSGELRYHNLLFNRQLLFRWATLPIREKVENVRFERLPKAPNFLCNQLHRILDNIWYFI